MPSNLPREEIERYRAANAALIGLMSEDLAAVWATLDLSRPAAARNALLEAVPALTTMHGEQAAVSAADWYDQMRSIQQLPTRSVRTVGQAPARVSGRFRAIMADPVPVEQVQARVRFGAQHLWSESPDQTLRFLDNATSEYVLQPGRDTIQQSAIEDPQSSGWHRETRPSASYTSGCGFCQLLQGRGGVYRKATARFAAHGNCHCVAAPSWDPDAPEVPAEAYQASERMDGIRSRAAAGDSQAQRLLDDHRASVRNYVAENHPTERIQSAT